VTSGHPNAGEPTRERVRSTIGLVGGYWRPLAAVARLLEELGELAELLTSSADADATGKPGADADPSGELIAAELADLWIISTALADQFLGAVAEPGSHTYGQPSPDLFASLVTAAGPIARVVNYYDGPKTPRGFDDWISLSDAVAEFHRVLADVAHAHEVDLATAVGQKLDAIPVVDSARFGATAHDPSTAVALRRFRSLRAACPEVPEDGRWWGGPDCSSQAAGATVIAADLASFVKASAWERLDAYLICGPAFTSTALRHDWLTQLLLDVVASDPSGAERTFADSRDGVEPAFTFHGLGLTVSTFDVPPADGTFALLRVEHATDRPVAR
jgi:NTP pyrophosphatase (non-canonical NTP hydrolase)